MVMSFLVLIGLFLIALTIMLVGLHLSSKTCAADQRALHTILYHRGTRRLGHPSRTASTYGVDTYQSPLKRDGILGYPRSPGMVWSMHTSSTCVSAIDVLVKNVMLFVYQRHWPEPEHVLKAGLRKKLCDCYRLILAAGLIFGASCLFLYREGYFMVSSPHFLLPYQGGSTTTSHAINFQIPHGVGGASKALNRLAQMDRSQYSSEQQYDLWAPSACSATAMTEVIDAYGQSYRISDILQVEIKQAAISSDLGLLELEGIDRTVAQFGFGTAKLSKAPLDSIISVANSGWPVIVDFPPSGDWPGGHFLVVIGGDSNTILLADSSAFDYTSMSRQHFLHDWGGLAVLVMPKRS